MTNGNKVAVVLASIAAAVITVLVCVGGVLAAVSLTQLDPQTEAQAAGQPTPEHGLDVDVDGDCKHRVDLQTDPASWAWTADVTITSHYPDPVEVSAWASFAQHGADPVVVERTVTVDPGATVTVGLTTYDANINRYLDVDRTRRCETGAEVT